MNVLLIDDDADDIELFRDASQELGARIVCWSAKGGEEALKLLKEELLMLPDFIFLDVNMPLMDGRDLLCILKNDSRLKAIPVYMYSTTSNDEEIRLLKNLGAEDFVIKPTRFDLLVATLGSVLLKRGQLKPA